MNKRNAIGVLLAVAVCARAGAASKDGRLEGPDAPGGLIVAVEPADAERLAAMRPGDGRVVQGLVRDADRADGLRRALAERGLHGPATILRWTGAGLPYADDLVNRIVVSKGVDVPRAELERVLAPGGDLHDLRSPASSLPPFVKPWPADRDEWTHYLYDGSGNAYSHDLVVGPPRASQWWSGPYSSRSHNYAQSEVSMVSGGGRLFYIQDEGPIAAMSQGGAGDSWAKLGTALVPRLPERWSLVARDAFNGVILWKRPLKGFGYFDYEPAAAGCWPAVNNVWRAPLAANRRVVASPATTEAAGGRVFAPARRDLVYATLDYRGGVTALDAATGATVFEYAPAGAVDEMVLAEDRLVLRCRPDIPRGDLQTGETLETTLAQGAETVAALDAQSGRELWTVSAPHVATETLCALGGRVCFYDYEHVVCLDAATGREQWRQKAGYVLTSPDQKGFVYGGWGAMLFLWRDRVFFSGKGGATCFDASTGRPLWTNDRLGPPRAAFGVPTMLAVVGDRLISEKLDAFDVNTGKSLGRAVEAVAMGSTHLRCHRGRATDRYLMGIMFGIEFYDIASRKLVADDRWLRSACKYGYLPANGLLYNFPDPCACWIGARIRGFNAFAPKAPELDYDRVDGAGRLEKGPAYARASEGKPAYERSQKPEVRSREEDWPTYRHDSARSGQSTTALGTALAPLWTADLGGALTPPTIAGGQVFVSRKDANEVVCLDADTGRILWRHLTAGAVDSPPTVAGVRVQGSGVREDKGRDDADTETRNLTPDTWLCFFGSADGWVYALRADDGALAWRFRAAPCEQVVVADGRPTSKWPVPGAVLVQDGAVYCTAGRSSFLDGGIQVYALDAATGRMLKHTRLDGPHYDPFAKNPFQPDRKGGQKDLPSPDGYFSEFGDIEGARGDILVSDGVDLHMGQTRLTKDLAAASSLREMAAGTMTGRPWLRPMNGFLDDTLFHRVGWFYTDQYHGCGNVAGTACAGSMLVFDDERVYAAQHQGDGQGRYPNHLIGHGSVLNADPIGAPNRQQVFNVLRTQEPAWSTSVPLVVRAMLLAQPAAGGAEKVLFVGGAVEQLDKDDPLAVYDGRVPGRLYVVAAGNGEKIGECALPSVPVWDGLAAAGGRLFVAQTDGKLTCLKGDR